MVTKIGYDLANDNNVYKAVPLELVWYPAYSAHIM